GYVVRDRVGGPGVDVRAGVLWCGELPRDRYRPICAIETGSAGWRPGRRDPGRAAPIPLAREERWDVVPIGWPGVCGRHHGRRSGGGTAAGRVRLARLRHRL
ncbi:hypothetical protein LTR53_017502, partial [Teratosphaeriaceae sp. CCFEE 6253]